MALKKLTISTLILIMFQACTAPKLAQVSETAVEKQINTPEKSAQIKASK